MVSGAGKSGTAEEADPPIRKRILRFAAGLAVVLACWGIGEWLARATGLPMPGSVLGMLLLTAALQLGIVPLSLVLPTATFLIRYMGLFFVPPGVAVLLYLDLVRDEWVALTVASLVGTFAVMLLVGMLQQRLERDG